MTMIEAGKEDDQKSKQIVFTQAIAGLLAKPVENPAKALGVFVQRSIQGDLLKGLQESLDFLAAKGRVKPDYFNTSKGRATLQELLKALNSEDINEEHFKAMKAIFLNAAVEGDEVDNSVLLIALMNKVNQLNTSQLVTLKSVWEFNKEKNSVGPNRYRVYLSEKTGLTTELVDEDIRHLITLNLITQTDMNGVNKISTTGGKLCDYLSEPCLGES